LLITENVNLVIIQLREKAFIFSGV